MQSYDFKNLFFHIVRNKICENLSWKKRRYLNKSFCVWEKKNDVIISNYFPTCGNYVVFAYSGYFTLTHNFRIYLEWVTFNAIGAYLI